ncbi:hypothetical protein ABZV14_40975 [Streptosporangium canum]|uniref:hypothetical protein n=1 Tax=Streptosporangium canum TaxID=324952 RepID=UPI0033A408F2
MFSERAVLTLLCAVMAGALTTGLMLADHASWPQALMVGLGAAGVTLLGVITVLRRDNKP